MNGDTQLGVLTSAISNCYHDAGRLFRAHPHSRYGSNQACLDLIRAIDTLAWKTEAGRDVQYLREFQYLRTGYNRALADFLRTDAASGAVSSVAACAESTGWANSLLLAHARLAQAERIVNLHKAGLIQLVDAQPSTLVFTVTAGLGLLEERDRDASAWLVNSIVANNHARYAALAAERPHILRLLGKRTQWEDGQLVYRPHREIESFYRRLADLFLLQSVGHDSLPPTATFGTLPFSAYIASLTALVGFAYTHVNCTSSVTVQSKGKVRVESTITPLVSFAQLSTRIADTMTCTQRDALEALTLLETTHAAIGNLAETADAPLPILIPVGNGRHAFSLAGAIGVPLQLLLRRLRARYPRDWDRHVDARDGLFRADLNGLFPSETIHCATKPVILKHDGREVTDLDAVIFVRATGTLGIFQLKWQEVFGADLKDRRNRMTNLTDSCNGWIQQVLGWIDEHGADPILRSSGFPTDLAGTVKRVCPFVLGRYHVGFGGQTPDIRAAWSTWPEVCQQVARRAGSEDPIQSLFEDVQDLHRMARNASRSKQLEVPLGSINIIVREEPTPTSD